ncbi:adenosylcobinamide-GDP ribazoletransferase [Sedimentitalea sp. JM2-8]|uniref:Adenosylcobinamide-GDP ribazoletransferase n=1 Tax=Sedimentitalea xiamensis TaxID=3050037 RepID=A0ABT7FD31_9RHOB|nr:adenosylcobinamide-GDP ribazoletransferase [Sedimentitalea xiamensis]MDK3073029.1 adenosylcobinamide-GDP ribazoletransferase [Sedimentitalea xiamensis]
MRLKDCIRAALLDFPVALVLLTRLPLPTLPERAFDRQARAAWAFPLVGLVIGAVAGGVGLGFLALGLPAVVVAGLVLGAQAVLTGALHEDGLADTADGFWGGQTRDRRLDIMKDSAIGSYGVLALVLSLGLRWSALAFLLPSGVLPVLAAAVLSRACLPVLMAALPHARTGGLSHSVGRPAAGVAALSMILGLALGWAVLGLAIVTPALCAAASVAALGVLARRKIGGQTGDVLGAAQQLAECTILLTLVAGVPG